MIGIRADANEVVATGHIMRCITIAKEIQKRGETVVFFLADEYGVSMLQEHDMPYFVLHTSWENPKEECDVLCKEIVTRNIKTMLFDSYQMNKEYFELMKSRLTKAVRMAYIDDLFEDVYPIDVIINYNAYHTKFPYQEAYSKTHPTELCLGPSFVPLREEFGRTNLCNGEDGSVLLSCGGGDVLQSLYGILEKAMVDNRFDNVSFHVVLGRFHYKKELLEGLAGEHDNIYLHYNVTNMAELMEENRIAVSAAGTMLYELCAMERPTVFFVTADNQRYDSDFFAEDDRMIFAGDFRGERDKCIEHILDGMDMLLTNIKLCNEMKVKLRRVTDGKGAGRIADVLLKR